MDILTLDFETFFDRKAKYNLGKGAMTTEEYVRDHRFQVHGASVRLPSGRCAWLNYRQLYPFFNAVDWSKTAVLAHHAQFDGLILSHKYDIKPAFWFDTLSMARQSLGNHLPKGLDALAKHFGLGAKNLRYEMFDGLYWDQMTPHVQQHIADNNDCPLTWDLFARCLLPTFPRAELPLIDITVRMFTEPMLEIDVPLARDIEQEERANKMNRLWEIGYDVSTDAGMKHAQMELGSNARFQQLLEAEGIEIAFKQSPADPGKFNPAFAKTDQFMRDLLESDDDYVVALAEARLGIKSTTIETRARTFAEIGERGPFPNYIVFCAAHTTRWGGGDRQNTQNLKRRHRIRNTIKSAPGYKLATPDASQIECRFLNYLAGQWDIVELFRQGGDPYCKLASEIYHHPVYKPKDDDPRKVEMETKRGTGKQGELSCGYGSGWRTFKHTASLGTYGPPQKLTEQEARNCVDTYRWTHPAICERDGGLWSIAENHILPLLASGGTGEWGPCAIDNGRIILPNGAPLHYDTLKWTHDGWIYRTRYGWTKMYGGKLVENWMQALATGAGGHIGACMATINSRGLRVVGMSHDETWVLIPEDLALLERLGFASPDHALAWMCEVIATPPAWLPDVPLGAEGKMGDVYAK